jgi:hypothetical protein
MPKRITVIKAASEPGYQADEHAITLDMGAVSKAIGEGVAKLHREAIQDGREPSGGSQRALGPKERKRAAQGKRNRQRGMGSEGRFPASIGSKATKGDLAASVEVAADSFFDDFQDREQARGVEYFDTDGDVDREVERILERELKRQGFG